MVSSRDYGDTPRQAADRNRLHCLERRHVDDGHIIREAVCDVELAAVRAERELPRPLSHQNVLLDLISPGVDYGHPVGAAQGHEGRATVPRELQSDGTDVLPVDAGNIEVDDVYDLMALRIYDRDRPSHFRGYPQVPLIRSVNRNPRPRIDEDIGHDLPGPGVDEMGHAGLLRNDHHGTPVLGDGETLRLYPDLDLSDPLAGGVVDHRDQSVVLIRHIEFVAGDRHRQRFGVRAGIYPAYHLQGFRVDDIDVARVAVAYQNGLVVQSLHDSPGPLVGRDRGDDSVAVAVEDGHRIVDFVRDEELAGARPCGEGAREDGRYEQRGAATGHCARRHCVSG